MRSLITLVHANVCVGSVALVLWGSANPYAALGCIALSHCVTKCLHKAAKRKALLRNAPSSC